MNPQDGQKELNPQHIISSLRNQIAFNGGNTAMQIAELNTIIIEQAGQMEEDKKRIKELEMENKQLHEGKETDKKGGKKDE